MKSGATAHSRRAAPSTHARSGGSESSRQSRRVCGSMTPSPRIRAASISRTGWRPCILITCTCGLGRSLEPTEEALAIMFPPIPASWRRQVGGEAGEPYFRRLEKLVERERSEFEVYPAEGETFQA